MAKSRDESHYLHGTDPGEQARLSRLNDLLNEQSLQAMNLRPGDKVLDVGSGLGQLSRGMARKVGPGRIIGVERSEDQLAQARSLASQAGEDGAVDFRQGEAARLPLRDDEWGTFEVAHARFVLEHVPDPLAVVRGMVRAVRTGGRIILEDDSHDTFRLWPEPPGLAALWRCYIRSYDRAGNDPLVGHRLVQLLHQAGAVPQRSTWLFFGACAGEPELLGAYVDNVVRILQGVREAILDVGEIEPAFFDETIAGLRRWGRRPDAALWYATSWAEGRSGDPH
jgi:ubiquinone/menaquinone biosynthesis C-methylase UbiE